MATFRDKVYTLREEVSGDEAEYFISFTDGQGEHHDLEVSENLFIEFRQMERKNRNLEQSDERHREYSGISDETLNRRARVTPKSVEEIVGLSLPRELILCCLPVSTLSPLSAWSAS